ncbi:MAG: PIG-L family deacetylase [Kiritimatiellae bacterium]|nr:PIG-L family deacetylase [Kiritimatiellia bacterium]
MNILALGAHPDDIEYGCGGLLLQAASAGHKVFLDVLTDGSASVGADRKREQEQAAEFLGAGGLFWGGFKDTELVAGRPLIVAIESVLAKVSPDMVFVNFLTDAHQDHMALASCAVTACRYVKRVFFYHDYTTLDFQPDTFVDISPVLSRKRELLAHHRSQVQKAYPTGLDMLESVTALAAYYGFMAKVKYAEGFKPLRNLMQL